MEYEYTLQQYHSTIKPQQKEHIMHNGLHLCKIRAAIFSLVFGFLLWLFFRACRLLSSMSMHVRSLHPSIRPCIYDALRTGGAGRERWQLKAFIKWFGGEQPQMELTAFKGKSSSSSTSSLVV